jgi:hypothetical protein
LGISNAVVWEFNSIIPGMETVVYENMYAKTWIAYDGVMYDATGLDRTTLTPEVLQQQQTWDQYWQGVMAYHQTATNISNAASYAVSWVLMIDGMLNMYDGLTAEDQDASSSQNTSNTNSSTTSPTNTMPAGSDANHIFSGGTNKYTDTPANRLLLTDISNDPNCYQGTDQYGKQWYAQMQPDGTQAYTYCQNGIIKGGGYNHIAVNFIQRYSLTK